MDSNLEHEDLLIKLRAKLNEEKIKLWEPPYLNNEDTSNTESLQELASKFSQSLNIDASKILQGLQELQQHSLDRLKDNEKYKETGQATFRVRVTGASERHAEIKITKPLSVTGEELIDSVAESLHVQSCSGKVIKATSSLEEQGVKNGALMMALIMAETPEQLQAEDSRYTEMKTTLEDAMLLSEHVADDDDEDDYMKLEDQSGREVKVPAAERRALLVGLALHERGRAAAAAGDHALALLLLLEADRQFESCGSATLSAVDNWAGLQLDVVWSYVRLRLLRAAPDAAVRLQRAAHRLRQAYGDSCSRVLALKGNAENERVMFCRLHLLQGVVAYHQNRRDDAAAALAQARQHLDALRVDPAALSELVSLGWSAAQARWGLRAGGGAAAAHARLEELRESRRRERAERRERRRLGACADGSAVSGAALRSLLDMGFPRPRSLAALRNANNNVTDAVRLIHDHPEMLESEGERSDAGSSNESLVEPDSALVAELVSMGYEAATARDALARSHNRLDAAVTRLLRHPPQDESENPSTSEESARKRQKKEKKKMKKVREASLARLRAGITGDEEDYLGASLSDEERLLAHYSALL
ncbi:NEDD8 ultimate buster 1 isoform X2 [Aricia agestis]|uniref:NEDD8 ultimate buster 1 isoform X2 n=1 Tax=Aricia agestis TaxID=91739 RepID=UPI001C207AF1|nr:NEDD8 ultimate buster 1 isoform X2 [Aricia agestis]